MTNKEKTKVYDLIQEILEYPRVSLSFAEDEITVFPGQRLAGKQGEYYLDHSHFSTEEGLVPALNKALIYLKSKES